MSDQRFREASHAGWYYLSLALERGEVMTKALFAEALKRSAPALRKQGAEQLLEKRGPLLQRLGGENDHWLIIHRDALRLCGFALIATSVVVGFAIGVLVVR